VGQSVSTTTTERAGETTVVVGVTKRKRGEIGIQMVQIRPVFIRINTPPGNARLGNSSVRDLSEPELKRLFPNVFLRKKA